jgi:methionyl-tRNA synthetase
VGAGGRTPPRIGKGIIRFHAVYWPAILLSADEPLPTTIFVHDYLTVDGQKLSKSRGTGVDPAALAARYGTDGLRWWFIRDVPRAGDADFREALLAARANELADDLGNLVNRTVTLVSRFRPEGVVSTPAPPEQASALLAAVAQLDDAVDDALAASTFAPPPMRSGMSSSRPTASSRRRSRGSWRRRSAKAR